MNFRILNKKRVKKQVNYQKFGFKELKDLKFVKRNLVYIIGLP